MLIDRIKANLAAARFDMGEVSGAFGDLGTLLPLLVGLVSTNHLPLVAALFFSGLFHVMTGLIYPLPIAIQPMKAIAAIALTEALLPDEIVAAGLLAGGVVGLLGVTGLVRVVYRAIPDVVVRGLQLGIGLKLASKGVMWAVSMPPPSPVAPITLVCLLLLVAGVVRRWPAAAVVFVIGLVTEVWVSPEIIDQLSFDPSLPPLAFPAPDAFEAAIPAALAQLPLTLLNSVISVVVLARDLYPDKWSGEDESTGPVTTRSVATTVGIMNVVGSLFGAMPMCHGAGGLAGQHLFGARTNGSVFMLGGAKMLVAVAFGAPLIVLIEGYPRPILGVLLLLAGVELAKAAGSIGRAPEFRIALLTGAAVMVLGALWGVILGLAAAWTWTLANRRASSEEG